MSALVDTIALLILVACAVRAGRDSAAAEKDPALAAAVDAHWDRTGDCPVWRGADFKRPARSKAGAR